MKISIITVTYNSSETLQNTIDSIAYQDYINIEYIIIDGNSQDDTVGIIKSNSKIIQKWISEPDKGLYDAMNKGLRMATGDIVGIINSDDFYHRPNAISKVVEGFKNNQVQCVFADIRFVSPNDLDKTVRYYSSKRFTLKWFKFGYMPAHPSFFTYRSNFEKFGYYRTDYKIAADFELLLRFLLIHKISYIYLPIELLTMRTGGASTKSFKSKIIISKEMVRACKENGIKTNYVYILLRFFVKIFEIRPNF